MFSRFIILYFAISSLRLTPIDCCTMSCIQVCNHRVVCWPNTQTNKCVYIYIYPNTSTHTDTLVYGPTLTLTLKKNHHQTVMIFCLTIMGWEAPSHGGPLLLFQISTLLQKQKKSPPSKEEEGSEWLICINCKAELFSQTETEATNVFSHIENTTCSLIAGRGGGGETTKSKCFSWLACQWQCSIIALSKEFRGSGKAMKDIWAFPLPHSH